MREFEQMEMQFFVTAWYAGNEMVRVQWKETRLELAFILGSGTKTATVFTTTISWHIMQMLRPILNSISPLVSKNWRVFTLSTDFDLKAHEAAFRVKNLQFFDHEAIGRELCTPYVVETSIGLDRMFLAVFSNSLEEEALENGTTRTVLKLPAVLAPTKAAIFPLVKKDGLPEVARKIVDDLKLDFNVIYDEKDAVGKRYRRQDAAGTPFCITVDHDSLNDHCVTIRHRDTMEQKRVSIADLKGIIHQEVSISSWLNKM